MDETAAAPSSSSDNSSRIASAFANTDATSQLQDINAAMQMGSNSTTSTATGDIKLAPSTKPKSKAPLIIIALLVLAGVGALVWATTTGKLNFGGGEEGAATPKQLFNEYRTLVIDGPKNYDDHNNEDGWFLLNLVDAGMSVDEQRRYTEEVTEFYKRFKSSLTDGDDELSDIITQYDATMDIAVKVNSLPVLSENVLQKLLDEDSVAARSYIISVTTSKSENDTSDDEDIDTLRLLALKSYLSAQLNMFKLYKTNSCIIDNETIDYACVTDMSELDPAILEFSTELHRSLDELEGLCRAVPRSFQRQTDAIFDLINQEQQTNG